MVGREGFEPSKAEPTDLQSVAFGRFAISPKKFVPQNFFALFSIIDFQNEQIFCRGVSLYAPTTRLCIVRKPRVFVNLLISRSDSPSISKLTLSLGFYPIEPYPRRMGKERFWLIRDVQIPAKYPSQRTGADGGLLIPAKLKSENILSEAEWSRWRDLNPRPEVYKTPALPLSYIGPLPY